MPPSRIARPTPRRPVPGSQAITPMDWSLQIASSSTSTTHFDQNGPCADDASRLRRQAAADALQKITAFYGTNPALSTISGSYTSSQLASPQVGSTPASSSSSNTSSTLEPRPNVIVTDSQSSSNSTISSRLASLRPRSDLLGARDRSLTDSQSPFRHVVRSRTSTMDSQHTQQASHSQSQQPPHPQADITQQTGIQGFRQNSALSDSPHSSSAARSRPHAVSNRLPIVQFEQPQQMSNHVEMLSGSSSSGSSRPGTSGPQGLFSFSSLMSPFTGLASGIFGRSSNSGGENHSSGRSPIALSSSFSGQARTRSSQAQAAQQQQTNKPKSSDIRKRIGESQARNSSRNDSGSESDDGNGRTCGASASRGTITPSPKGKKIRRSTQAKERCSRRPPPPPPPQPADCPICLGAVRPRTKLMNCGHEFCKDCILEWVERAKPSCPICRQPAVSIRYNFRRKRPHPSTQTSQINTRNSRNKRAKEPMEETFSERIIRPRVVNRIALDEWDDEDFFLDSEDDDVLIPGHLIGNSPTNQAMDDLSVVDMEDDAMIDAISDFDDEDDDDEEDEGEDNDDEDEDDGDYEDDESERHDEEEMDQDDEAYVRVTANAAASAAMTAVASSSSGTSCGSVSRSRGLWL